MTETASIAILIEKYHSFFPCQGKNQKLRTGTPVAERSIECADPIVTAASIDCFRQLLCQARRLPHFQVPPWPPVSHLRQFRLWLERQNLANRQDDRLPQYPLESDHPQGSQSHHRDHFKGPGWQVLRKSPLRRCRCAIAENFLCHRH